MFCKHNYEILKEKEKETCTEMVIVLKCSKCGKVCIKKTKINNHMWKIICETNVYSEFNAHIPIRIERTLQCVTCGKLTLHKE